MVQSPRPPLWMLLLAAKPREKGSRRLQGSQLREERSGELGNAAPSLLRPLGRLLGREKDWESHPLLGSQGWSVRGRA